MSKGRTKRNRLLGLVNHWTAVADEWDAKDRRMGLVELSAESVEVRQCAKELREVIDEMYEPKAAPCPRRVATYKLGSVLRAPEARVSQQGALGGNAGERCDTGELKQDREEV